MGLGVLYYPYNLVLFIIFHCKKIKNPFGIKIACIGVRGGVGLRGCLVRNISNNNTNNSRAVCTS